MLLRGIRGVARRIAGQLEVSSDGRKAGTRGGEQLAVVGLSGESCGVNIGSVAGLVTSARRRDLRKR